MPRNTSLCLESALLASLSHDLRTPLVSIIGSLTAVRDLGMRLSSQEQGKLIAVAIAEAERLNQLIKDLLDITRIASSGLPLRLGPVCLDEAIAAARSRVSTSVRIDTSVPAGFPPVRADRLLFEQALINLLENAAKYSPAGGIIRIVARQDGSHAAVVVNDDGAGIDPADRSRIFDLFYRGRRRADIPGTGLGLAICRGFIEAMGGAIMATDRSGRMGATFEIRLNLCSRLHTLCEPRT